MREGFPEDLRDFIRNGALDAYELTDEEIARMLEVWRWGVWRERAALHTAERDVRESTQRLQRHLARTYNIEVEYNTAFLLKQEIEALMFLRTLRDVPRAIAYFLRPTRWFALLRAHRRAKRYEHLPPAADGHGNEHGYPAMELAEFRGRAPNLLKRRYWRQISPYTFEQRKQKDQWW